MDRLEVGASARLGDHAGDVVDGDLTTPGDVHGFANGLVGCGRPDDSTSGVFDVSEVARLLAVAEDHAWLAGEDPGAEPRDHLAVRAIGVRPRPVCVERPNHRGAQA